MSVQERQGLGHETDQTGDQTLQYINAAQQLRDWINQHWNETPEGQRFAALESSLPPGHPMQGKLGTAEEQAKEFAVQRILSQTDPSHVQCFLQMQENRTYQEAMKVIGPVLDQEMHLFLMTELPRQLAGFGQDYWSGPEYTAWYNRFQGQGPQGKQQGGDPGYGGHTSEK